MLKLVCDIRCGFEDLYLVEKNLEFPLEFLTDGELQQAYSLNTGRGPLTEEEVITLYTQDPTKFMTEYGVFNLMRTIIAMDYAAKFFQPVLQKIRQAQTSPVFFPELFRIDSMHLVRSKAEDDEEDDQINPDLINTAGQTEYLS